LQIIPELETGGAELSAIEIAGAVVRAGGRALVLSEGGQLVKRLESTGAEFVPFPAKSKNPLQMMINARRILRMIAAERVDLVHARSRAPAWSAEWAARKAGVPFVTTYHGIYNENSALKKAYNRVMAKGDIVIANSAYTAGIVRQRYGTPESRLTVIHRGVDPAVFDPAAVTVDRRRALLAKWEIRPDVPIILQAARLSKWKGQGVLIDALARLRRMSPSRRFALVLAGSDQGRDRYRAEIEAQIAAEDLAGHVVLAGHVDDIPAAMALAHVVVVASIEPEAFGRTAIEAQALGSPIIATGHGAPPETVIAAPIDARTGWLVPPGDAEALAKALDEVLEMTNDERSHIGHRGRLHVEAQFSLDAMRLKTLGVYDRLLGTRLAGAYVAADPQSSKVTVL